MELMFAAAKAATIPAWAFGVATGVVSLLLAVIGWFIRREFQKKEQELQQIKNVLYGYTGEDGTRKAGLMETVEDHIKEDDRFHAESLAFQKKTKEKESEMSAIQTQTQKQVDQQAQDIASLRTDVADVQSCVREENEKNREAIAALRQQTEKMDGKLEIIIGLVQPKNGVETTQ